MDSVRDVLTDPVNWVVFILLIGLFAAGWIMLFKRGAGDEPRHDAWRALGSSLITGACVSLALFLLQAFVEDRSKAEDFRQRIAFSGNLSGFDPGDHDLHDMNLAGKTLNDARLDNAKLERATLQDSVLIGANLNRAHLAGAVLIAANLTNAALGDADLHGADLREAQLDGAQLYAKGENGVGGKNGVNPDLWKDVKVNFHTCWPRGFDYDDKQLKLHAMPTRNSPVKSRGRYCDELKPSERLPNVPGSHAAG